MRHIDRLSEPDILAQKHDEWQAKFEASGKDRPDSSKYGHKSIREQLKSCSHNKCFYCECSLVEGGDEVDHYREVSEYPELAYAWENLYLACSSCNDKAKDSDIPVSSTLDPCRDSDDEIRKHITFEDEVIIPKSGSEKGDLTIKKFRLEKGEQKRLRWLKGIFKVIMRVQKAMIADGRTTPTEDEREEILQYKSPYMPFSLMTEVYINKNWKELIG